MLLLLLSHFSHVDSVQPHRLHPPGFPCPWDSPGKNTGVRCHFLLQCMKVKSESEVVSSAQQPHGLQPTRLLQPRDFPGKSTGVGCHCLLHLNMSLAYTCLCEKKNKYMCRSCHSPTSFIQKEITAKDKLWPWVPGPGLYYTSRTDEGRITRAAPFQ